MGLARNDNSPGSLNHRLSKPQVPRSSNYDPHWLVANMMGPDALWLAEWLVQRLELTPRMRVLELGFPDLARSTRTTLRAEEFRCDRELRCPSLLWNRRLVFGVHSVVLTARRPIEYRRPGHSGGAFRGTAASFGAILDLGLLQLSFSRLVAPSLGKDGTAGN